MHALLWMLLEFVVGALSRPQLTRQNRLHRHLEPLAFFRINEVDASQFPSIADLWLFPLPNVAFPFSALLLTCWTVLQATK